MIAGLRHGIIPPLLEVNITNKANKSKTWAPATDIVFDCPHCGKSLAIDARGAGLMINCPECEQDVQVPGVPLSERQPEAAQAASRTEVKPSEVEQPAAPAPDPADLSEALQASHTKIERLVASLEEVRERRRYLEKLRSDNMARFDLISKELVTIQNAMDRIVAIIQDAAAEKSSDNS